MRQNLINYFSILETKIRLTNDVKKYYGKEISPNFNSFDFWFIDENKVSEILAYFLRPNENHEQGDVFLKIFINKLKLDFTYTVNDKIEVICEKKIDDGRRIDILITKNKFEQIIGVENKLYINTSDQKNQVFDYIKYLEKITKNNYCLLYLRPQEKELSEFSINSKDREIYENNQKLKIISYEEHIIDCIHEFSLASENDRVKSFLKDFEKKLIEMYMGENSLNEGQIVVDYINENKKNLEISFQVANSLKIVKNQLKEKFENQLIEIGIELGIKVTNGMHFTPSKWKNHDISFSYEGGGIIYGITRNEEDKKKTRFPEIEDLIDEKFQVSPWWSMWQYFYRNIESNDNFWKDIYDGTAKTKAKEFIKNINDNFNKTKY